MKKTALITSLILFTILATTVKADVENDIDVKSSGNGSSATVQINNKVNTGNSTATSFSSQTDTKVHITQEGEGTSSVTVNGKEWKLDGPGEINVNESSDKKTEPTNTPTLIPNEDPTPTETVTSSPAPTDEPENNDTEEDINPSRIQRLVDEVKQSVQDFFDALSDIF